MINAIRLLNPDLDWLTEDIANALDAEYIASGWGDFPLLQRIERLAEGRTESQLLTICANLWVQHSKTGYVRHHNVADLEYNVLDNYNGTETFVESAATHSGGSSSTSASGKRAGYNTSTMVDTDSSSGSSQATTDGTVNRQTTLNRHGNLGVTTSQQMIRSELDLWSDYDDANALFNSINKIILQEVM